MNCFYFRLLIYYLNNHITHESHGRMVMCMSRGHGIARCKVPIDISLCVINIFFPEYKNRNNGHGSIVLHDILYYLSSFITPTHTYCCGLNRLMTCSLKILTLMHFINIF